MSSSGGTTTVTTTGTGGTTTTTTSVTHHHATTLQSTSNVSMLLATTREEVHSRDRAPPPQSQSARRAAVGPAKPKLSASLTRGQFNRTFFANAPLFTMPPVGAPPTQRQQQQQHQQQQQQQPLFFKTNSQASMAHRASQQASQASFVRQPSHASSAYHPSNDPHDDMLYSPDMPTLVPYRPTDLNGPLPATVWQKPFAHNAQKPPPQQQQQPRMYHTAPLQTGAYPQPHPQPLPPQQSQPHSNSNLSLAANPSRLARTYAPPSSTSSQVFGPFPPPSNRQSTASLISQLPPPPPPSGRLELLEYLSSPDCSLFSSQVHVLGSELDSMLDLCGGLSPALSLLQRLNSRGTKVVNFPLLLELVRSQVEPPTLSNSGSKVILRAGGQPIPGARYQPIEEKTIEPYQQQQQQPALKKRPTKKQAAALANGGVEFPADLRDADRDQLMQDIITFISSPQCVLFPAPSHASTVAGADEPDIKIDSKDLDALVALAPGPVTMRYLHQLNQQLSEVLAGSKSVHAGAGAGNISQPFRTFASLLGHVQSLHSRTLKAKQAVLDYLNSHACTLLVRGVGDDTRAKRLNGVASNRTLAPSTSNKDLNDSNPSVGPTLTGVPPFTPWDLDRLWLGGQVSCPGEEVLPMLRASADEGIRIDTKPFLKQIIELIQTRSRQQQQQPHQQPSKPLQRDASLKDAAHVQPTPPSTQSPSSNSAGTNSFGARKKKKKSVSSSTNGAIASAAVGEAGIGPSASSSALNVVSSNPHDPASIFSALNTRGQRFLVELTAFFRSPKCKVFEPPPTTPTNNANTNGDTAVILSSSSSSKLKHPIIDAITNEDLVDMMEVAGEVDLFETTDDANGGVSSSSSKLRSSSSSLVDLDSSSSSLSTSPSSKHLFAHSNRALFFLTAINTAITLPKPTMKPVQDWKTLLQVIRMSHEQSLVAQAHLLDRLTSPQSRLFANIQVRRVPDTYSSSSHDHSVGVHDDDPMPDEEELSPRMRATRSIARITPTHSANSVSMVGGPTGDMHQKIPTAAETNNEADEVTPSSERILYISSLDMHRLFFESMAGLYTDTYLDSFEHATPPRTFFDFNGLIFGVKVAHLLWLSQQKQDRFVGLGGPPLTTTSNNKSTRGAANKTQLTADNRKVIDTNENATANATTQSQVDDDPDLSTYRHALNLDSTPVDDRPSSSSPSDDSASHPRQGKNASTQTPLSTGPLGFGRRGSPTMEESISMGMGLGGIGLDSDRKTPPKSASMRMKDEEHARMSIAIRDAQHAMTLSELGVHLRSNTVQQLLFDPSVLPLTITQSDLAAVLASARDFNGSHDIEAEEWAQRDFDDRMAEWRKEVAIAEGAGKEPPPPPEREVKYKETDPIIIANQAAASQAAAQLHERAKCALILSFLHQLEAPAIAANFPVSATPTVTPTPAAGTPAAATSPRATATPANAATSSTTISTDASFGRTLPLNESSRYTANAQLSSGHPPIKFHSIAQLCDALYLEYALHRSKEDTLSLLRSSACRLLPEGSAPVHLKDSSSAAAAATSKLQNMCTGGIYGTISASDVNALYKHAKAGLYTLPILCDLNNEHLRAFDLDSLISMVASNHAAGIARIKAQKFLLLTHLSGNLCRIFPKPVRVTDAHLDLLLTATKNSGSAALYYLHQLSLHNRSFTSMDEVIGAVRYMLAHPNPFKNRIKQLLSSPMCIVMNRQKERVLPTDSVVDRLWDVQQAGIDALTHIQSLHADANGFSSYVELVTAVAANQASARSSQQEADKFVLMCHLASPLNGLFSYPLYDITITPKHLDQLLGAGGGSASVVLFHLEHLDVAGLGRGTFDGMPPLIAKIAELHGAIRAQDEKLLTFLNSRVCRLFRDWPPGALTPFDDAAVERLLIAAELTSSSTYALLQDFNNSDPPRSFQSLDDLAAALRDAGKANPLLPGRSRNSLNNFGQPKALDKDPDTQALPIANPVRLAFPGASTGNAGLVVDKPQVHGLFYSDGSMPLDAEEGVPGTFVVDPAELYDYVQSPQPTSLPGSGRVTMIRPLSASALNLNAPPSESLDPFELALRNAEREKVLTYLMTRCGLFRAVDLQLTDGDLDETIAIAGTAKNVLVELTRMDAVGVQFNKFDQMIAHLRDACQATQAMETQMKEYQNPAELENASSLDDDSADIGDAGPAPQPKSSADQATAIERAIALATAMANGDDIGDEYRYTDADQSSLRAAVDEAGVLTVAQSSATINLCQSITPIDANTILIIGGGVDSTTIHLNRFHQARRQLASIDAISHEIESAKSSGIYASNEDHEQLASFLQTPPHDQLQFTRAGVVNNFRDLSTSEIDIWIRGSNGAPELMRMLAYIDAHNRKVSAIDPPTDSNGVDSTPTLAVIRSPSQLKSLFDSLTADAARVALFMRQQAREVIKEFIKSEAATMMAPTATNECNDEEADTILDALSPNAIARSNPAEYQPSESDLEFVIDRLYRFDSVGRKFPSVSSLCSACRVASLDPASVEPSSPDVGSSDNLPGAFASNTQRRIIGNYLTADTCGLLPVDARKQIAALSPAALDELLVAATAAARAGDLHPLSLGNGPTLPRYITPLYRLQMRSPTSGAEYDTIDAITAGLRDMAAEAPIDTEPAIEYITASDFGPFVDLPSDGDFELNEYEVVDLIRLFGGDWSVAHAGLAKIHSTGVRVQSMRGLQQQAQRAVAFGLHSSGRDRKALKEYMADGQRNSVLQSPATLSESQLDTLLQYSQSRGAAGLISVEFARVQSEYPEPAVDFDQLVRRIDPSKSVSDDAEPKSSPPPTLTIVTPPKDQTLALPNSPAQSSPSTPRTPLGVSPEKLTGVIQYLSSPECRLYSESPQQLQVTRRAIAHLILAAEVVESDDRFSDVDLPAVSRANITLYFLLEFEKLNLRLKDMTATESAIREVRRSGTFQTQQQQRRIIEIIRSAKVMVDDTIEPSGSEFDELAAIVDLDSRCHAILTRGGQQFSSIKQFILFLRHPQPIEPNTAAPASQPDKPDETISEAERRQIVDFLNTDSGTAHPLLPAGELSNLSDSILLSWRRACVSVDVVVTGLRLFSSVHRQFGGASEIEAALIELVASGLAITLDAKHAFTAYANEESTQLFVDCQPKDRLLTSLNGSEWSDLFVVGCGLDNLIGRCTYLDTIGERFQTIDQLKVELAKLHDQVQPTEQDRNELIEFLGGPECTLFDVIGDEDQEMEISSSLIDALILSTGGSANCLATMRGLQSAGWKVQRLDEVLLLILKKPAPGARQVNNTNNHENHATTTTPEHPNGDKKVFEPDTPSDAHSRILEYLSDEHVNLFAPLAATGGELSVTDLELTDMITSTDGSVDRLLTVLAQLDKQGRGFTTLKQLAEAVDIQHRAQP